MNPRWAKTCSWRESCSKNSIRVLVYLSSSLLVAGLLFAQGDENLRKRREDMVQTQIGLALTSESERCPRLYAYNMTGSGAGAFLEEAAYFCEAGENMASTAGPLSTR